MNFSEIQSDCYHLREGRSSGPLELAKTYMFIQMFTIKLIRFSTVFFSSSTMKLIDKVSSVNIFIRQSKRLQLSISKRDQMNWSERREMNR